MLKLIALNPCSNQFEALDNNLVIPLYKELSIVDKLITVLATAIITLCTLGCYTRQYYRLIVHRFTYINSKNIELKERLEVEFWNFVSKDTKFHNRFQMILINGHNEKKQAEYLVDIYFKSLTGSENKDVIPKERSLLIDLVKKQINLNFSSFQVPRPNNDIALNPSNFLNIYNTRADGSCGFHAILGTCVNDTYQCEDIAGLRQEFCDWLSMQHAARQLPQGIYITLTNYALDFSYAPPDFQCSTVELYTRMMTGYEELTQLEKDRRLDNFIYDPIVINAYTDYLKKVSTFLLQDELIAIGEHYGLRVLLFQYGWGRDGQIVSCNVPEALEPNFQSNENDVCVWFSGMHYEHASLSAIPQIN